jgi:hypothetical protein
LSGGGGPQAYSAAKAAVINLTQSAAVELAPHRIRVNAICPGAVYTDLLHRGDPDAADEWRQDLQPWPDRGEPSDIAGVATWLASDDSRFVSGAHIVADGALTAAGPRLTQRGDTLKYLNQLVGFAWGNTGKPARYRRLTESRREASSREVSAPWERRNFMSWVRCGSTPPSRRRRRPRLRLSPSH